jgi:hypothetical protein
MSTNLSPHTDYAMHDVLVYYSSLFLQFFLACGPKGRNVFSMLWLVGQIGNLPLPSTTPPPSAAPTPPLGLYSPLGRDPKSFS